MTEKHVHLKLPEGKMAAQEIAPMAALQKAFEVSEEALASQKINEIVNLLWFPQNADETHTHERILRALELYESLTPADGAEGMLALQMVGTHDAALECLRRAAVPNQTFERRDVALKHAHKLMTLYTQQLATLNKHRGKGQQKVTVEHVNVEPGGQAIVGNVEMGPAGSRLNDLAPVIEHAPIVPAAKKKKPKSKASKKKKKRSG